MTWKVLLRTLRQLCELDATFVTDAALLQQ